jgi:hypothetical protein
MPTGDIAMTSVLTTLANFTGANGFVPRGSLIADANGDLFGTTEGGGVNGDGTVFEIVKTGSGYAGTPTTLVSFTGTTGASLGADPFGSLIADANGDLLGTTAGGGANNGNGTVFEIVKTGSGYASTPTTLVSFATDASNGAFPLGSLIADANGDLFGTTEVGGVNNNNGGTVFEIVKTGSGYASTPTTLVSFTGANGFSPRGSLIADANGDLFGTTFGTAFQGAANGGTVFEIVKTGSGYASTPTTLVSFTDTDGANPTGDLIADANGDLFGTTSGLAGGANNGHGTVFEIVKTGSDYASTPTTLVSFTGANGAAPRGSLIADANGDLFGTTSGEGTSNAGTVFEIVKTGSGYASTPTTLVSFTGTDGAAPLGSLIADASGDLFGTTAGTAVRGGNGGGTVGGTVFEITGSGFVTSDQDNGPEVPTLTAPSSLRVPAGSSIPLGIKVSADSDDTVMVTIDGVPPGFASITADNGHAPIDHHGSHYTFMAADVNAGLTLQSTYKGKGHPEHTFTVTATNTTAGETATSTTTITVTDPPSSSTSGLSSSSHSLADLMSQFAAGDSHGSAAGTTVGSSSLTSGSATSTIAGLIESHTASPFAGLAGAAGLLTNPLTFSDQKAFLTHPSHT